MSSETSTREVRPKPDDTSDGLHPWQFFVLAALGCATAVTFIARGQGATTVILLGVLMATAALVGLAVLRTLRPLVSNEEDRTAMIGQRTRVALEREKALSLKSIKELEFDRAMGRLSDADWKEMSGRLRARAARIIRQLDSGSGYRDQIERDLAKRIGEKQEDREDTRRAKSDDTRRAKGDDDRSAQADHTRSAKASAERVCAQCATANDTDARFCKSCGNKL